MNYYQKISDLGISEKILNDKKEQTNYKIKYVVEYIKLWILVSVNREEITNINFVDCMCNAGIYKDGDLCTAMEVLSLFITVAQNYPDKKFNLFINDNDLHKIQTSYQISKMLLDDYNVHNLKIYYDNIDVNDYLINFTLFDKNFMFRASTVLFVAPYDFGTVKINRLTDFINRYYCEVLFNFFISDYVRNGIDNRIRKCIGNVNIKDKEELLTYIVKAIKVGKMQYAFSYQFRTCTNTELYYIIFITPSKKGLEKLKEALWKTFNGKFFHKNTRTESGL